MWSNSTTACSYHPIYTLHKTTVTVISVNMYSQLMIMYLVRPISYYHAWLAGIECIAIRTCVGFENGGIISERTINPPQEFLRSVALNPMKYVCMVLYMRPTVIQGYPGICNNVTQTISPYKVCTEGIQLTGMDMQFITSRTTTIRSNYTPESSYIPGQHI